MTSNASSQVHRMTIPDIKIYSPAKINLSLEILRKRNDGFHEIKSIVQTVSLSDIIEISSHENIEVNVLNACIPIRENLVVKAAQTLQKFTGCYKGAKITINKRIPLAAGLGGGSSNAATVLRTLNGLWDLNLPHEQLLSLASELGADVPFFLTGGTAFIEGKGEKVRSIPNSKENWYFIVVPNTQTVDKTRKMYSLLDDDSLTKGFLTRKLEARLRMGGDLPSELMFNGFYSPSKDAFEDLPDFVNILQALGAKETHLSGSGPALFCRIANETVGHAMRTLARHKYQIEGYVVKSVGPISTNVAKQNIK